jgi:hypothetical protein
MQCHQNLRFGITVEHLNENYSVHSFLWHPRKNKNLKEARNSLWSGPIAGLSVSHGADMQADGRSWFRFLFDSTDFFALRSFSGTPKRKIMRCGRQHDKYNYFQRYQWSLTSNVYCQAVILHRTRSALSWEPIEEKTWERWPPFSLIQCKESDAKGDYSATGSHNGKPRPASKHILCKCSHRCRFAQRVTRHLALLRKARKRRTLSAIRVDSMANAVSQSPMVIRLAFPFCITENTV